MEGVKFQELEKVEMGDSGSATERLHSRLPFEHTG